MMMMYSYDNSESVFLQVQGRGSEYGRLKSWADWLGFNGYFDFDKPYHIFFCPGRGKMERGTETEGQYLQIYGVFPYWDMDAQGTSVAGRVSLSNGNKFDYINIHKLASPSTTMAILDSARVATNTAYHIISGVGNTDVYYAAHGNMGNIAFYDGHVQAMSGTDFASMYQDNIDLANKKVYYYDGTSVKSVNAKSN